MMVNGTTWEQDTRAKLDVASEYLKRAKDDREDAEKREAFWREYITTLQRAIELDKNQRAIICGNGSKLDPENLRNMSVKDAMLEIARANNGLLVVIDAATTLINAGVFQDRDSARNSIYSNISHYKKLFERERAGIYRLVGEYRLI